MRVAGEVIFGSVIAVLPATDLEDPIAIVNDVRYGLSASIVTQDLLEVNRFVDEIESGVTMVNEKTTGLELHVPFGGMKASSSQTYREHDQDRPPLLHDAEYSLPELRNSNQWFEVSKRISVHTSTTGFRNLPIDSISISTSSPSRIEISDGTSDVPVRRTDTRGSVLHFR